MVRGLRKVGRSLRLASREQHDFIYLFRNFCETLMEIGLRSGKYGSRSVRRLLQEAAKT